MTWLQFWLWVASVLISDYFRERLPSQTASGIGDFNIPTATEGRVVPVMPGGTVRVEAPNCIWYGLFEAVSRTVTTGLVFKKEEEIGFTYRLALQYALFKGEAEGITGIWIGDDQVFNHIDDAAGVPQEFVDVDRDDLFGGKDGGGGFVGRIRLHNGSDTQAVSTFLDTVVGLDPLPAYRGTCYVMITNMLETAFNGFLREDIPAETIGANIGESNNLRYIRVEVQQFGAVAGSGRGDRLGLGNDHHFIGPDANPVSVAYELYLNDKWGRAFPPSDVDAASFTAAAEVCYTEGIGYTQFIDELTTTGQIQDTLEQHIDGYIGPNPITGLIEVSLSRPDYVLADEFQVTDDNIVKVEKYAKGDWSQTFNRVRIRYTDRDKQWNESHAIELAPGNRIIQGKTKTKELRYQGVHTASVARIIAARAKRTLSLPQSAGTLVLDRTAWEMRPGSVLSLTSSQAEETEVAMRVTKAGLGDGIANTIQLEIVADLSGNETPTAAEPPPTDFVPPIQSVDPFDVLDQAALEAPFLLMLEDASPAATPRIVTFARRGAGQNPIEYEVLRRVSAGVPAGAYTSTHTVRAGFSAVGTLRDAQPKGITGNGTLSISVDPIGNESLDGLIAPYSPASGNMAGVAVISPGLATEEFIFFDGVIDDGTGISLQNVWRSAMDTVWKAHAVDDRVWFIWTGGMGMGSEVFTVGNNVEMKLLPRSPNDAVIEGDATALPIVALDDTTTERHNKPLVPYQVTINGTEFPTTVDCEETHTAPDPDVVGVEIIPSHRLWRSQDIQWSVKSLNNVGAAITDDNLLAEVMEVSAWFHDLDGDPSATRANALHEIIDQLVVTSTDPIYFELSDLIAGGAKGFEFNARLEIETKHSPTGETADNVSHEAFEADFIATGIFSIEPEGSVLSMNFDHITDTSVAFLDNAATNSLVDVIGDAQHDTAQQVFGPTSLLCDGTGDGLQVLNRKDFNWELDWTIDFRVRFANALGTEAIVFQGENSIFRGAGIRFAVADWQFLHSTDGDNAYTTRNVAFHSGVAIDTWYAVRFVHSDSLGRISVYIDGTRIGTLAVGITQRNCGADWRIGHRVDGAGMVELLDGHLDHLNVYQAALINPNDASYTVEVDQRAGEAQVPIPLLAQMEGANLDVVYQSDDRSRFQIAIGGTSEIDTAQSAFGSASMRCDGVGNLTVALCDGAVLPETENMSTAQIGHPAFNIRRNDFTMQCRFRFQTAPSGNQALIAKESRAHGGRVDWTWRTVGNNQMAFVRATGAAGQWANQTTYTFSLGSTMVADVWYHAAICREGVDLVLYFEGDRIEIRANVFLTDDYIYNNDQTGVTNPIGMPVTIGRIYGTNSGAAALQVMDGWIDAVKINNGEAEFSKASATYTIPAAAPTGIKDGGTDEALRFLWGFLGPDGGATDRLYFEESIRGSRAVFLGNSRLETARSKFGGTSYLTGSVNDGLIFSPSNFWWDLADDDFTLDMWYWPEDGVGSAGGRSFANVWLETGNERCWRFAWHEADAALEFAYTVDGSTIKRVYADLSALTIDTWQHFAVERIGSALHLYHDGVLLTNNVGSDAIGTDVIYNSVERGFQIGRQDVTGFIGDNFAYFDEVRLTKSSEYGGASFTVETAEYPRPPALPNF